MAPDFADQGSALEEQAREEALAAEADRRRRIAESMRGYDPTLPVNCVDCGEIVPEARLKAYPHTRRCVDCSADIERTLRERRG